MSASLAADKCNPLHVGASRLFDLAHVLEVPVSFFFDDMPDALKSKTPLARQTEPTQYQHEPDDMHRRETLELVRAYYQIPDAGTRKKLFELVKSMGAAEAK